MNKLLSGLLITIVSISAYTNAFAATAEAKLTYKSALEHADAEYKINTNKCNSLASNAKDVCIEEAVLARTTLKAQANADYENTPKARATAISDVADAQYAVDKEKCNTKVGNDKDVCMKQAKATNVTSIANAKATNKVTNARGEAAQSTNDADYQVEIEKCDGFAGPSKAACIASAQTKYGK
ncbi:hypothetical protein [Solimicrobium silvestre]|uniref:Uncharacterized protein n=1 Tax=Solimicrobium silvestre TaxID=2099400 RepID=A0A2S9GUK4_9BURK|nr:hypothetical protein [Solimicrobium silvestre]PRC91412.1 hypothetical protein S2091_3827 [Solimicrobium silvestre]